MHVWGNKMWFQTSTTPATAYFFKTEMNIEHVETIYLYDWMLMYIHHNETLITTISTMDGTPLSYVIKI